MFSAFQATIKYLCRVDLDIAITKLFSDNSATWKTLAQIAWNIFFFQSEMIFLPRHTVRLICLDESKDAHRVAYSLEPMYLFLP